MANINFSKNGVYLNTLNNETFLTFFKEINSDANISITNIVDDNNLYINGISDFNDLSVFDASLNANNNMISYYIFTNSLNEFDSEITFKYNDDIIKVPIYNRPDIIKSISNKSNSLPLNDNKTSTMMLRTNPKLTGNIKIVIDKNDKIYLDTFKVSNILSSKKYRKQEISCEDYYSNSVRNVFGTLPKGDIYKLDDNNYNAFNVLKTFENQYNTTYIYGAKTNDDELYNENFSLLAPLWINKELPDYFLIFRIDDAYEDNTNLSAIDIFKKYMSKAKLIKSYNLQNNSPIGKFLRKHLNESNVYPGSVFIPYNNLDNISWYGIAIDKGVITERVETPYFINKINNQTWADNYLVDGFERNNLISSKLLNMEFMFDDDTSNIYSINRYFGIYVKRNDFINGYYINYYNNKSNSYETVFINENDAESYFTEYKTDNDIIYKYLQNNQSDKLFSCITPNDINRISINSNTNLNSYLLNNDNLINMPYLNIVNTPATELTFNKNPFITITLNNILYPGEHLRILGSVKNNSKIIYEVIFSNAEIINEEPYVYEYSVLNETYESIKIYRISFNCVVDDVENPINEQLKRIVKSFKKINEFNDYEIVTYNNNSLSIINLNTNNNLIFQRINSNILGNTRAKDNDLTYFGDVTINKINLKINNDTSSDSYIFNPINFELWGNRETYIIDFALGGMISNPNSYNLYIINDDKINDIKQLTLYKSINNEYKLLHNFEISYYSIDSNGNIDTSNKINLYKNYVLNYNDLNTYLICSYGTNNKIFLPNNIFSGYSPCPISFSLLGYLPIKDFDFTIYDSTNINLNFNPDQKTLNFKNDYFNNKTSLISNDDNLYTFNYNDGSIYTNYENEKYLLKNRHYKVINGSGIIIDNNGNVINISTNDVFNTFDFSDNKFYCLRSLKQSPITIKLYNEFNSNSSNDIELLDNSEEYIGNIFNITANNDEALNIANQLFINGNNSILSDYDNIKNTYNQTQISLTTPTNNKWESIDLNCSGKKTELIWNLGKHIKLNDASIISNYIPITNKISSFELFNNSLMYGSYKYMYNDPNKLLYVFNDVNDVIDNNTIKNLILSNDTTALNTLMYYNSDLINTKFAIGYYNKFTKIYEFTISGVRFNISINNLSYLQDIDLSNYNNYLVTLVMNPSKNKNSNNPIEFIINEINKFILIIWYQGNDDLSLYNRNNIFINPKTNLDNNNIFVKSLYDSSSLYQNERFIINFDNITEYNNNLILPIVYELNDSFKQGNLSLNDLEKNNSLFSIMQFNNNIYYRNSYTKYYNTINDFTTFIYDYDNNLIDVSILSNLNKKKVYTGINTFNDNGIQKMKNYILNNPVDSYEMHTLNYSYNKNSNLNVNSDSCLLSLLKKQLSNNLLDFYIIKNDSSIHINSLTESLNIKPINVEIKDPILNNYSINDVSCYVYNSFYNPKMKKVFIFDFNENTDIINFTNKNYILCNTSINTINNIDQLWINKVCYNNSNDMLDFDNQTISIDYINNFNILKSNWDNDYYFNYEYTTDNGLFNYELPKNYIGIESPYENKSYFGSKCIVLKNNYNNGSFIIKNWNLNNITINKELHNYNDNLNTLYINKIRINLTQSFIDELLNNKNFINNWKYFNNGNINNIIINYIKNSVLKYYIINNKNNLTVYYKDYNGSLIEYSNNNFSNIISNLTTNIIYQNDNYYLEIEVPDNNQYTYYFNFKIDRKNS